MTFEINFYEFARTQLSTYNIEVDENKAIRHIEEDLRKEFEELNQQEVKESRYEYFDIPNSKVSDYSERFTDLGNDKHIIHGIRHKGGNRGLAFIDVKTNFGVKTRASAIEIFEKISNEYKVFDPKMIRLMVDDHECCDVVGHVDLVSQTSSISEIEPWELESSIELIQVDKGEYYQWYEAGYKKFHHDNPHLRFKVPLNLKEDMETSRKQGLLKSIELNGKRVGLIAGERNEYLGDSAIYFNEIFVDKEFQRQGIAKAAQRKFIDLFCREVKLVWGTIDSENHASFKTALTNGRIPVHFETFFCVNS